MPLDRDTIKERIRALKQKRKSALEAKDSAALADARFRLKSYRRAMKKLPRPAKPAEAAS